MTVVIVDKVASLIECLFYVFSPLHQAREVGRTKNRWLMVNVQNVQEFACQVLNRDVWSNATIKSIVSEHFVFWQVSHQSSPFFSTGTAFIGEVFATDSRACFV